MPREQELSDRENKRLRAIARKQLEKAGSQTKLAEKLGIHQTVLSKFLGEKIGASYEVARRLAELEQVHLVSVLGPKSVEVPGAVNLPLLYQQLTQVAQGLTKLMELVGPEDDRRNPALRHQLAALAFTWTQVASSLVLDPQMDVATKEQLDQAAAEGRRLAEQAAAEARTAG